MKGVIIAAGKGTRLLPLTEKTPKVMIDVGGKPILEHIIELLKSHGIKDIIITTHHLASSIHEYFREGGDFGVNIVYTVEKELVGTAGGIAQLGNFLDGTFVLVYGDNMTNADITSMAKFHRQKKAAATIGVYREQDKPESKGIVETDSDGRIVSFEEKPEKPKSNLASGAVYMLEPSVFRYITEGFCDFGKDVFPAMLKAGERLYAFEIEKLIDIGTFETLEKARTMFR
ncbi:MAG: nucleotidyltransferase family protein [Candidatus Aenigmarchaeota archaeon]|nr:nucleotidyltransferase family protein [Candidatus Aenigmarchaeota archaeon]